MHWFRGTPNWYDFEPFAGNYQWWALYRISPVRRPSFVTGRPTSPSSVIRHYFGPVQSVIRRSVTPSLHFDHASVIAKLQFVTAIFGPSIKKMFTSVRAHNQFYSFRNRFEPLNTKNTNILIQLLLLLRGWKKIPKVVFAFWAGDDSGDGLKKLPSSLSPSLFRNFRHSSVRHQSGSPSVTDDGL